MEGKKKVGSSSSSFHDLFGSKETHNKSTTTGVFASMFQPPSTGPGKYSGSDSRGTWQRHSSRNQEWNTKKESHGKSENGSKSGKKEKISPYQEARADPCNFSSSIHYGGQDIYSNPSSTHQSYGSSSYPIFEKNGEEGDSNGGNGSQSASRGNWWEGSLYY